MKKLNNPFGDITTANTSRQKATDYLTPDGKERDVPENLRGAFDYLIMMRNGTKSSFDHTIKVEDREIDYVTSPDGSITALTTFPPMSWTF